MATQVLRGIFLYLLPGCAPFDCLGAISVHRDDLMRIGRRLQVDLRTQGSVWSFRVRCVSSYLSVFTLSGNRYHPAMRGCREIQWSEGVPGVDSDKPPTPRTALLQSSRNSRIHFAITPFATASDAASDRCERRIEKTVFENGTDPADFEFGDA